LKGKIVSFLRGVVCGMNPRTIIFAIAIAIFTLSITRVPAEAYIRGLMASGTALKQFAYFSGISSAGSKVKCIRRDI
jgi:hypothetical protein